MDGESGVSQMPEIRRRGDDPVMVAVAFGSSLASGCREFELNRQPEGHSDSVYTPRGNGSPADAFLRTPSQKSDPESGIY